VTVECPLCGNSGSQVQQTFEMVLHALTHLQPKCMVQDCDCPAVFVVQDEEELVKQKGCPELLCFSHGQVHLNLHSGMGFRFVAFSANHAPQYREGVRGKRQDVVGDGETAPSEPT
jgi:hypothetical protein